MRKIYLAGPHVFHRDVANIAQELQEICNNYGFEGIFPIDNSCSTSKEIYQKNIELLTQSDIVIAYLEPFRGISADPGTVFEVGYAKALNKPVYGYREDIREYKNRTSPSEDYPLVEDFGLGDNLMIEHACTKIYSYFELVLKDIANNA
jgi:nucleoside 2-deoxyribosyltransferase